ncbi:MAG: PRC-barrel domain-containing protein [Rhodospirillales bacterium]|jgi:hypothetical protein
MTDMASITTGTLIAAEQVKGTAVYNKDGEKLGTVAATMIDKVSGRAIYAVMSFGGFLGIGERHHPLPWATLKYDTARNGYVVDIDAAKLAAAPTYATGSDFEWTPDYGCKVDDYYAAPSFWRRESASS